MRIFSIFLFLLNGSNAYDSSARDQLIFFCQIQKRVLKSEIEVIDLHLRILEPI